MPPRPPRARPTSTVPCSGSRGRRRSPASSCPSGSVSARASKYRCAELKPVVTQAASKMPSTATVLRRSQPSSARAMARDLTEPSEGAVARLAGRAGCSAERVHAQTGGNPFCVTELLASPPGTIPVTVRDATLARALRLSPQARAVLELCAVVPNRVERWLLLDGSAALTPNLV